MRCGLAPTQSIAPIRHALSAIEGVQLPGWGGYDYAKLAHAVDVMEIYDSDENLPLIRSINPAVIPLITSFGATPADLHGIWRSVLRGARGLILWDEDNSIVRPDASPGPRAAAYAPIFAALRGDDRPPADRAPNRCTIRWRSCIPRRVFA